MQEKLTLISYFSLVSRDIFHIRDNFMKSFMADKEMSIEFIRTFFPSELTKILDFSTLKLSSNSFISDRLKDRKSTRLNSSHVAISYAVFCLTKNRCFA